MSQNASEIAILLFTDARVSQHNLPKFAEAIRVQIDTALQVGTSPIIINLPATLVKLGEAGWPVIARVAAKMKHETLPFSLIAGSTVLEELRMRGLNELIELREMVD